MPNSSGPLGAWRRAQAGGDALGSTGLTDAGLSLHRDEYLTV